MNWKQGLIKLFTKEFKKEYEYDKLSLKVFESHEIGIHLAVFNEPFLALLYKGEKTIESRFSINRVPPFQKVNPGDVVFMKSSGGPVSGFFIVGKVRYFSNADEKKFVDLERLYGKKICTSIDPNFWETRRDANYVSLLDVKRVVPIHPFKIDKKDRTAWCVLRLNSSKELNFEKVNRSGS